MVAAWIYIAIMAGATMSMRSTAIIALVLAVGMLLLGQDRPSASRPGSWPEC